MVTSRRYWITLSALIIVCTAGLAVAYLTLCPVCHLGIVRAPEVVASRGDVEPSENLAIWNGSYHGPPYEDYSRICTRCWMAYHDGWRRWERASEIPDSFRRPLIPAIRNVPLPPRERIHYRVVYSQYVTGRTVAESVGFWCDDSPEIVAPLQVYAEAHKLYWRTRDPSEERRRFVSLQTDPTI